MKPDTEEVLGGIDRVTFNVAAAVGCLIPTLIDLVGRPWRAARVLLEPHPSGRTGLLLNPGVFFVTATTAVMVGASWLITPEVAQKDTSLLGSLYAHRVASAVQDGNLWRVASLMGPVYLFAIFQGVVVLGFFRRLGRSPGLYAALGAGFYQVGTSICWITATSVLISQVSTDWGPEAASLMYDLNSLPILLIPLWQYYWAFRLIAARGLMVALTASVAVVMIAAGCVLLIERIV